MHWIAIGLISHFFWALVNTGDKFIVENKIKNPVVYFILFTWIGTFPVLLIPFFNFYVPEAKDLLLLFVANAFWFYGGIPYILAAQREDITRINVWWGFIPLWSLILGYLVFGETLTNKEFVGFSFLALAAIIASIHAGKKILLFSKAVFLMILAGLFFAAYGVLLHQVTNTVPFLLVFFWSHVFGAPISLTLFLSKKFRKSFTSEIKEISKSTLGTIFGVTVFDNLGLFFNQWALSLSSAALVFSLEGSQVVFVFLITLLIGLHNKKLLNEELNIPNVLLKLSAILLMLSGIVILSGV